LIAGGTGFDVLGQMLEGFEDLAGVFDWFVLPFRKSQSLVRL
jgi:hypothetical protein